MFQPPECPIDERDKSRFVGSGKAASATEEGRRYALPGGILKEIGDAMGESSGGFVDSIKDIAANGAGWCHGPGAAVFGDSCEDLADGLCP